VIPFFYEGRFSSHPLQSPAGLHRCCKAIAGIPTVYTQWQQQLGKLVGELPLLSGRHKYWW